MTDEDKRVPASNSRSGRFVLYECCRNVSRRVSLAHLTNPSVDFGAPHAPGGMPDPHPCCIWPPLRYSSAQIVDSRRFGSAHRDGLEGGILIRRNRCPGWGQTSLSRSTE